MRYFFLLFMVTALMTNAQVSEKNFIDQNYIEVTGKAEMQVVPDLIYLKITLSEKDNKNKISIAEMEKRMTDKFVEIGIDVKKDLSINDLLSFYKNKFLSKADVILSKEYQLVVHDAKTAGKVFGELEKLDISNMSVDRFDHSRIEEFRKEVKINAIKAAKDKADFLTKTISQSAGRAIYIREIETPYVNVASNSLLRYDASSPKEEADLDFEKIKLEYSVLVRFELR